MFPKMKKRAIGFLLFFVIGFHPCAFSEEEAPKTVLVTGGAGFIGSNFLQYMFDKYPEYNFIVLDALTYAGSLENIPEYIQESERFKFIKGCITNFDLVDEVMSLSDFVVHFAAETHVTRSIQDDYAFFETDVLGTRVMMMTLVKHMKTVERFIHISTSEVYGTAVYEPMDELHPLNPKSPYAAAKAGADRLVYAYCCTFDVPAVIVRPFNNYGPKQHMEKMIPRFITAAIQNEPLTIHGDGSQGRDWLHTHDTAAALDKILHAPDFASLKHQEINLGSGVPLTVLEVAKMILKIFHLPQSHLQFVGDRPGQVELHHSSMNKARELLDWTPSISFEDGLKQTIKWYLNNPEIWEKMKEAARVPIVTKSGTIELH